MDYIICCDNQFLYICEIIEESWIKLVTSVYFHRHPKFFKSKTIACIHYGVTHSPTADPFANMLKWLGCTEKITDLKGWHNFIRRATFHLSSVGKDYEAKVMPSWDALVLHCKRANYVMNMIHSANSTSCSILKEYKHYGWKHIDNHIAINWGSVEQIFDDSQAGCGCHGGCSTNRCSCHSAGRQCTLACRCTNCFNQCSIANINQQNVTTTTEVAIAEGETMSDDSEVQSNTDDSDGEKIEQENIINIYYAICHPQLTIILSTQYYLIFCFILY